MDDWDKSSSIHVYITTYFEKTYFNSFETVKITSSVVRYGKSSSQVAVTKMDVMAGQSGAGFDGNGNRKSVYENKQQSFTYPSSVTDYTMSTGCLLYTSFEESREAAMRLHLSAGFRKSGMDGGCCLLERIL